MRAEILKRALTLANKVVPSNTPKPILRFCKLGDSLTATNLDTTLIYKLGYWGKPVLLPVQRALDALKVYDGDEVEISVKDNDVILEAGATHKWHTPLLENFPERQGAVMEYKTLDSEVFKSVLKRTEFATANEATRYELNAISIADGQIAATDGRRLALTGEKGLRGINGLVPASAPSMVAEMDGEVSISIGKQVVISSDEFVYITQPINGNFPNFKDIIPDGGTKVSLIRKDFINALKQVSVTTTEETKGVSLTFGDKLELKTLAPEVGGSEITIDYSGKFQGQLGFNPYFLIEGLSVLDDEMVEVMLEVDKPALFEAKNWKYVVMPINIGV